MYTLKKKAIKIKENIKNLLYLYLQRFSVFYQLEY